MKRIKNFVVAKKWWVLLIMGVVVVGAGLFLRNKSQSEKDAKTVEVKQDSIRSVIEVSGKVDARRKATLKFLGGGKLVYMPHEEGKYILKGSVVASVDARDLQKSLSKSLNDYLTDRATFDQATEDRKDTALTDAIVRTANKYQYSLNNAVLDVELRDIALKNASLTAPFNGVITSLPVKSEGVQVTAADGFEMVDPTSLVFEGEVDEVDIAKVKTDMPVEIRLDAYPDETLKGTISSIGLKARVSSSSGGTVFPVVVSIVDGNVSKFRMGLNGTMDIISSQKENVIVIPIDATSKKDDKDYVQVATQVGGKQTLTEREVKIGIESDETIEVLSGLQLGEMIVIPE